MKDEHLKNLIDAIQAAEEIRQFTQNLNFDGYKENKIIQRAVERNFEIIGEPLNRFRKDEPESIKKISDHERIIGFRNILIHGYDIIDEAIVWDAVKDHLPVLMKQIKGLIE